ncbi:MULTISPECIES: COX15/CtaA family protein [Zeaxanthinibacter]|uniref:COX15/CtaA family protein n=1 Tax=Zeaxanthinibacter TaxID=561554 RepID=UPI00300DDBA9
MNYRKIAKVSLLLVYLVIIAGAVVRMTGSGMGCPDWPKCFGYYIPPTEIADLEWKPDHDYKTGQVIIRENTLRVAAGNFQSGETYDEGQWKAYTRHDYAEFNVFHTWTEFLNRLLGALAGIATLVMAVASFSYWKRDKFVTLGSCFVVLAMGFQAWLGATVVYSVLAPAKITIHMLMALAIVAILLLLIYRTSRAKDDHKKDTLLRNLLILALGLTVVQVVLGTQVRQFVDQRIDLFGEEAKAFWLKDPGISFYIHRSFSILVVLLNSFLAYRIYQLRLGFDKIKWVLGLIMVEILTGIAMVYLDFPFASQPLHLVLASLLFGLQFYLVLEVVYAGRNFKTS